MQTLDKAHDYINRWYRLTGENCPLLRHDLSPTEGRAFIITHGVKHIQKAIGVIATETEVADHGVGMRPDALQTATVKIFINAMMMAHELGLSPADIAAAVPAAMKSKPTS